MAGMLYSLVALGFVLIYKASGVFNFAQGAMVLFAALAMARFAEWVPRWTGLADPLLVNLIAFALAGVVMFWFSPLTHRWSRKHEYEADAFAREAVGGAQPMIGALRQLARKNLSNLTPHRWFSGFYYSHPTLVEREEALVNAK